MGNTCGEIVTPGDCYMLHDFVSDGFMGLAQYNDDSYPPNIRSRCAQMVNSSLGTPFDRLVAITKERVSGLGLKCVADVDGSAVTNTISFAAHLAAWPNPS